MNPIDITTAELPERLLHFMKESLGWCVAESENSTQLVMQAVEGLIKKAERVSSVSAESLKALGSLKDAFARQYADKVQEKPIEQLLVSLEALSQQHREVSDIIGPVVEALQFQDLLRQNLENMIKLTAAWIDLRARAHSQVMSPTDIGEALLKCTSTVDERNIIRRFIDGLPPEEALEGRVAMF
jgi:hypothetical protein